MGLGEVCGRENSPNASGKELFGRPPLLVQREPRPIQPPLRVEPETFHHAILTCLSRARNGDLLLNKVSSLGHAAATWTEPHLIRALGEYITTTKTGFPPEMIPEHYLAPSSSPPPLLGTEPNFFMRAFSFDRDVWAV